MSNMQDPPMPRKPRTLPPLNETDQAQLDRLCADSNVEQLSLIPPPDLKLIRGGAKAERIATARQNMLAGGSVWNRDDVLYYPSILCQISMPTSQKPGSEYTRKQGDFTLSILTPLEFGIPYGIYTRGILAHISSLVIKARNQGMKDPQHVRLGESLTDAVEIVTGKNHRSGGKNSSRGIMDAQIASLTNSTINFRQPTSNGPRGGNMSVTSLYQPIWQPQLVGPANPRTKEIDLIIDDLFYRDILAHGVPLDTQILRALWPSCLKVDLYSWLTYKANARPGQAIHYKWSQMLEQFGFDYAPSSRRSFKQNFREAFNVLRQVYDPNDKDCVQISLDEVGDTLWIMAKRPSVPTEQQRKNGTEGRHSFSAPSISSQTYSTTRPHAPKDPTAHMDRLLPSDEQ